MRTPCLAAVWLGLLIIAAPVLAQVDPDPLIAPVVFHWSQVRTAWPTLEGGAVGDLSQAFWQRQIKLLESSGFTGQLFQVSCGDELSQRNTWISAAARSANGSRGRRRGAPTRSPRTSWFSRRGPARWCLGRRR